MAYASFHENHEPLRERELTEGGMSQGKALAKIYGYMGLGLVITGVVAVLVAWLFSSQINALLDANGFLDPSKVSTANGWLMAIFVSWIVSLIAILILSFVIPVRAAVSGKSLWVPFILYTIFMGIALSAVLLAGIPFWMIGEAFGITALAFGGMFLIGWFSKKDLSALAFIAMSLLMMLMLAALIIGITFAFRGSTSTQRLWVNIGINVGMIVVILLITAVDTYRIKKIVNRAGESENIYLYCAFVMYTDFISLLLRILYVLAKLQGNRS